MNPKLFEFCTVWKIAPAMQIGAIVVLYCLTVTVWYEWYRRTGAFPGSPSGKGFPVNAFVVFAPIYEEAIFRGLVLGTLLARTSRIHAVLVSSLLFGLWHLKNVFHQGWEDTFYQVAYAGLFIGPFLAWLTLRTGTIWPGVIVHFLNNLLAPLSWVVLAGISVR